MKFKFFFILFASVFFFFSCSSTVASFDKSKKILSNNYLSGNSIAIYDGINDSSFVKLTDFTTDFLFDMKYATEENFLKSKVYDCAECYLRLKTIKNLIQANEEFKALGYQIKIFDCYRPLDVQKKMWEIMPNADYVANPARGSIHNRGGAIDVTLVDAKGKELEMGTEFDFFGPEASHNYPNSSKKVKQNRLLLKSIMLKHNFKSFDSEWWHYNLNESIKDKLANFKWECH